jgi:predicted metal-dependent hydrolase
MTSLNYFQGYPSLLQEKVKALKEQGRLQEYLSSRYIQLHSIQSDKALYAYTHEIKQAYLKNAPSIDKVLYDGKLDVMKKALGLHTAISRAHGGKLKAKKEIRIASLFKEAAPEFLNMIVVHELAHLKEHDHNRAFYQLCEHMLPGYHQLEFDLRIYLLWRDQAKISTVMV